MQLCFFAAANLRFFAVATCAAIVSYPRRLYAREDGGASRSAEGALCLDDEADGMQLYREKFSVSALFTSSSPPKHFARFVFKNINSFSINAH
ncbi:hypothetical protein [Prevotellamassilia timonensis]|uniref:hypothetical protein n=1 Tax=Prevotellamassilia timonensis TaxID=1852370 RepID=UPI001F483465|nr:hypothetical protein [Prevotellamassilia timonensis]MCF2635542.1 hypothetical protein [Prevotellamassilia timonensis]